MTEEEFHKRETMNGLPARPEKLTPEQLPAKIGPYPIESLLEKGGMSLLYLACHPETKEPITVKVLSPRYSQETEVVKRFLKEAEIIALADHPNIVKLYGQGTWEGGLYIAMEFVQGVSLKKVIQHRPMSLKRALELVLEISYALCHLHTHGVIHRDLKPENVLLTETGQVKVIDFGIAQLLSEAAELAPEKRPRVIGTPFYMSPEQRDHPDSVSFPSDIYSLGIIAYELILGRLSQGHLHLSLIPKGLQKILSKALQENVDARYQDIVEFISDITSYLGSPLLTKERKGGNFLGEITETLEAAVLSFFPKIPPELPYLEIGITHHKGLLESCIYCDFLGLGAGSYCLILAEPFEKGVLSVMHLSTLRGMVHALYKKARGPKELALELSNLLHQSPFYQKFSFQCLYLKPQENQYFSLSCGSDALFYYPEGGQEASLHSESNPFLGEKETILSEAKVLTWKTGDLLLLTMQDPTKNKERALLVNKEIKTMLSTTRHLPAQKQAEILFRRVRTAFPSDIEDHSLTIVCLKRL